MWRKTTGWCVIPFWNLDWEKPGNVRLFWIALIQCKTGIIHHAKPIVYPLCNHSLDLSLGYICSFGVHWLCSCCPEVFHVEVPLVSLSCPSTSSSPSSLQRRPSGRPCWPIWPSCPSWWASSACPWGTSRLHHRRRWPLKDQSKLAFQVWTM